MPPAPSVGLFKHDPTSLKKFKTGTDLPFDCPRETQRVLNHPRAWAPGTPNPPGDTAKPNSSRQKRVKNPAHGQHHLPGKAEVPLRCQKTGPQGLKEDRAVAAKARFWFGKALTHRN